jgi:hypothetical protein
MGDIVYAPRASRFLALDDMLGHFKPKGYSLHTWLDECYNAAIQRWIDIDPVFLRAFHPDRAFTVEERECKAYYAALDHATLNGAYTGYYKHLLEDIVASDDHEEDCA